MPWVPEAHDSWHPDLQRSLQQRARQKGKYDQTEIDRQYLFAAGLRILTEWGYQALPRGDSETQSEEHEQLLTRLEEEVIQRIEGAVPYHLKDKAPTYMGKEVSKEMREQLSQRVEEAMGGDPGGRMTASGSGAVGSSWSRGSTWGSSSSSSWWQEPRRQSSGWQQQQSWWQQPWKRG